MLLVTADHDDVVAATDIQVGFYIFLLFFFFLSPASSSSSSQSLPQFISVLPDRFVVKPKENRYSRDSRYQTEMVQHRQYETILLLISIGLLLLNSNVT